MIAKQLRRSLLKPATKVMTEKIMLIILTKVKTRLFSAGNVSCILYTLLGTCICITFRLCNLKSLLCNSEKRKPLLLSQMTWLKKMIRDSHNMNCGISMNLVMFRFRFAMWYLSPNIFMSEHIKRNTLQWELQQCWQSTKTTQQCVMYEECSPSATQDFHLVVITIIHTMVLGFFL